MRGTDENEVEKHRAAMLAADFIGTFVLTVIVGDDMGRERSPCALTELCCLLKAHRQHGF